MRKKIICIVVCVVLLTIAICTLPLPQKLSIAFDGYAMGADGTVGDELQIEFVATKYRYLLKNDVYHKVSVKVNGVEYDTSSYGSNQVIMLFDGFECIHFPFFDNANQVYRNCTIALGTDGAWIGLGIEDAKRYDAFYVGSVQGSLSPSEIWNMCSKHVEN